MQKVKEFIKRYRYILIGVLSVILVIASIAGYLWWYSKNGPVATVNGKKITRESFNKEKENLTKVASVSGNSYYGTDEFIKKELIEREIVELIAKENGITVSQEEIDESIKNKAQELDNNIDAYRSLYESAYGLDSDEFNYLIRYDLLKSKISEKLIAEKSGKYIYTRFGTANGVEEIVGIKTEELQSWAEKKINDYKTQLDNGKNFNQLYEEVRKEDKYPAYYGEPFVLDEKSEFPDNEKKEILKTEVGKYTPVINAGKYFVIYNIEKGNGKYQSWESLINDYRNKYVKYSILSQKSISRLYLINKKMAELIKIPVAFGGSCAGCSGCDGARVYGYVWDDVYTNIKLSGGKVSGVSKSSAFCNGSSTPDAYCGYRTGSDATDTAGYYNIPRQDGVSCRFNCAGGTVSLTTSFTNYANETKIVTVTNGSQSRVDFALHPAAATLTVSRNVAGGYIRGTGISCYNGGTVCSYTYHISSPNTSITGYSYSNYTFNGWDVDADGVVEYTSNPLTYLHTRSWNIKAMYTYVPPPASFSITPSAGTGCTISPDSIQSVTQGGSSVPFQGSSQSGYTFNGFSIDGGANTTTNPYTFTNVTANHTITAQCTALPPELSCNVTPRTGLAPLVVSVLSTSVNIGTPVYEYDMNWIDANSDNIVQASEFTIDYANRGPQVYYTYGGAGTYKVAVHETSSGLYRPCPPLPVNVTAPSSNNGGEVAP